MDFFTPSFVAPVRTELAAPKYNCQILLMLVNNKYIATMGHKSKTGVQMGLVNFYASR